MGSVSWSLKYFPQGRLSEAHLRRAEIAAQAVLEEALTLYPRAQWDTAYGSSGTVNAVAEILAQSGWPAGVITLEGLRWVRKCLIRAGHVQDVHLEGLREDRRAVIGGGVTVLSALMGLLHIDTLHVAEGALRQGVLFDMLAREDQARDTRDNSVTRLALKFGVDMAQAERVRALAQVFWQQLRATPQETPHTPEDEWQRQLGWACQLHEIGMAISHSDHHKHGAYILDNADMLGFGLPELHRLGLLILGQKGKLRKLDHVLDDDCLAGMLLALRLAVILCHARQAPQAEDLKLHCDAHHRQFVLHVPHDWCDAHPQSSHLLQLEVSAWTRSPWTALPAPRLKGARPNCGRESPGRSRSATRFAAARRAHAHATTKWPLCALRIRARAWPTDGLPAPPARAGARPAAPVPCPAAPSRDPSG